uniref:Uncharacterized protein n=1 Tax=Cacopsylla melanoneura TaxID=428564 RepID=A0A8D9EYC7_9HEMI
MFSNLLRIRIYIIVWYFILHVFDQTMENVKCPFFVTLFFYNYVDLSYLSCRLFFCMEMHFIIVIFTYFCQFSSNLMALFYFQHIAYLVKIYLMSIVYIYLFLEV